MAILAILGIIYTYVSAEKQSLWRKGKKKREKKRKKETKKKGDVVAWIFVSECFLICFVYDLPPPFKFSSCRKILLPCKNAKFRTTPSQLKKYLEAKLECLAPMMFSVGNLRLSV